ncbi:13541_t:CDS:1, partial [Dentiscutata heterogama]
YNAMVTIKDHANTTADIIQGGIFFFVLTYLNYTFLESNSECFCIDGNPKLPTKNYDIDLDIIAPKLPSEHIIGALIYKPMNYLTIACGFA